MEEGNNEKVDSVGVETKEENQQKTQKVVLTIKYINGETQSFTFVKLEQEAGMFARELLTIFNNSLNKAATMATDQDGLYVFRLDNIMYVRVDLNA